MIEVMLWLGDGWVSYGIYLEDAGIGHMDELARRGYYVMHKPV